MNFKRLGSLAIAQRARVRGHRRRGLLLLRLREARGPEGQAGPAQGSMASGLERETY